MNIIDELKDRKLFTQVIDTDVVTDKIGGGGESGDGEGISVKGGPTAAFTTSDPTNSDAFVSLDIEIEHHYDTLTFDEPETTPEEDPKEEGGGGIRANSSTFEPVNIDIPTRFDYSKYILRFSRDGKPQSIDLLALRKKIESGEVDNLALIKTVNDHFKAAGENDNWYNPFDHGHENSDSESGDIVPSWPIIDTDDHYYEDILLKYAQGRQPQDAKDAHYFGQCDDGEGSKSTYFFDLGAVGLEDHFSRTVNIGIVDMMKVFSKIMDVSLDGIYNSIVSPLFDRIAQCIDDHGRVTAADLMNKITITGQSTRMDRFYQNAFNVIYGSQNNLNNLFGMDYPQYSLQLHSLPYNKTMIYSQSMLKGMLEMFGVDPSGSAEDISIAQKDIQDRLMSLDAEDGGKRSQILAMLGAMSSFISQKLNQTHIGSFIDHFEAYSDNNFDLSASGWENSSMVSDYYSLLDASGKHNSLFFGGPDIGWELLHYNTASEDGDTPSTAHTPAILQIDGASTTAQPVWPSVPKAGDVWSYGIALVPIIEIVLPTVTADTLEDYEFYLQSLITDPEIESLIPTYALGGVRVYFKALYWVSQLNTDPFPYGRDLSESEYIDLQINGIHYNEGYSDIAGHISPEEPLF